MARLMESAAALGQKDQQGRRRRRSTLPALCAALVAACTAGSFAFAASRGARSGSAAQASSHGVARRAEAGDNGNDPLGNEWRMNVGHAIDVLRVDVVAFFEQDNYQPDYSIYSENIELVDGHVPSFHINGKGAYKSVLSTMQWSLHTAFEQADMQITSVSPPVNSVVQMRWKLDLLPRDFLGPAKDFLAQISGSSMVNMPVTVEGYSHYEFDPWTGEIVRHTVDVKNPPTLLTDLLGVPQRGEAWGVPTGLGLPGVSMPGMPRGFAELQPSRKASPRQAITAPPAATSLRAPAAFAGASVPGPRRSARASVLNSRLVRRAGSLIPRGCEDDFECNDGKANFPLQCCELPIFGGFCCEPPDEGGLMVPQAKQNPAYVPLPVPVNDGPQM